MHNGEPYGHLARSCKILTYDQIAKAVGYRKNEVSKLMPELFQSELLDQFESGLIYSPYLLAKFEETEKARERGRLGGNPNLKRRT